MFNNYPEFDAHKEQHQDLLFQLDDFERKFKAGEKPFNGRMLLFLKDWLVRHIILHDCKFAHYLRERDALDSLCNHESSSPHMTTPRIG
jgi:hemerythrin